MPLGLLQPLYRVTPEQYSPAVIVLGLATKRRFLNCPYLMALRMTFVGLSVVPVKRLFAIYDF